MSEETATRKVRTQELAGGALLRVTLCAPKGNVLDSTMTAELTDVFDAAAGCAGLRAVLLTAEGRHFSFGASVEEHLPDQVAEMLAGFHGLFRKIGASSLPVVAAVRGSCLGGGLELAAFCHRVVAHPEARFGQPEITLGVFAPVAAAILADRIGRGAADDLLLSGRVIDAREAASMRLVDAIADDPEAAALAWVEEHLLPRSASSLRLATRAARLAFLQRFDVQVAELERLYLDDLMATHDAPEGIRSFLEKRSPKWRDA